MPTISAGQQVVCEVKQDAKKSFGLSILKGVDYEGVKREGFVVSSLSPNGLGAASGIQLGDAILTCNGVEVTGQDPLFKQLKGIEDGATVTFAVDRVPTGTPVVGPTVQELVKPATDASSPFHSGKMVKHPLGRQERKGLFACCGVGVLEDVMVTEAVSREIQTAEAAAQARKAAAAEAAKNPLSLTVANDKKRSFGFAILKGVDYEGVKKEGFVVSSVAQDGLAAEAKMKLGDVLLSVDGVEVTGEATLFKQLKQIADGATVTFSVAMRA